MRRKTTVPYDEKPIFFLVDALRKAGSVIVLAGEIGVADSAIYNWLDCVNRPNRESIAALREYLNKPEQKPKSTLPVVIQPPRPLRTYHAETIRETVEVVKVFLGASGKFVAFGNAESGGNTFITPLCINQISKEYGGIYEGDVFVFDLVRDITGRSTYISHRYIGPA